LKKYLTITAILFAAVLALTMMITSRLAAQEASGSTAAPSLDYEFFKTRVEPIFLKKRPGHARCYVCHSKVEDRFPGVTFRLQVLAPGSTFWNEEQSQINFEAVSALVVPGHPTESRFLMHPLASEAGGDVYHHGGKQFASQDDPDWRTMAEWARGEKAAGSSKK
jgi:hypothetical protein